MILSLAPACRGLGRPGLDDSYRTWARGPVRWLMLPAEENAFRRLRTSRDATRFVEEFWRRRDPDPRTPENPYLDTFWERVEAADRLYGEGRKRGAMTDRGRTLVVLGPPSIVRVSQQAAPDWNPRRPTRDPGFSVRQMTVESWEYRPDDLWPQLLVLLDEEADGELPTLTFVVETDRSRLTDGARFLELAARAAVGSSG